ncbi:MAG: hypothetical protein HUU38_28835 [Anaerolineales bacterium]|nr:hypothetical protein [Anaerolineales bacterium]
MTKIGLNQTHLATFVLVDAQGVEVSGLGTTFTVQLSKNGGAFLAGTSTKAEIGSGWYSYLVSASDTDTAGPLALKITAPGAAQQNLLYEVSGSLFESPVGPLFATVADVAAFLQIDIPSDDEAALRALGEATAAIRNYTRQYLSRVEDDTITLDAPHGRRLFLPELPVVSVETVIEESVALVANTDYRLDGAGLLHRLKGNVWNFWGTSEGLQNIEVTYTHGYDPIPDDIVVIATRAAARAYQAGLKAEENGGVGGLISKQLGDYSVGFSPEATSMEGTMGVSAARLLLMSEKDILNKYRI